MGKDQGMEGLAAAMASMHGEVEAGQEKIWKISIFQCGMS